MKRSSGKTVRFVSVLISLALALSLVLTPELTAFAAVSGGLLNAGNGRQDGITLREAVSDKAGEEITDGKDPLEGTVVVLMKDGSVATETKVRRALSTGEDAVKDIEVEEVWNFDAAEQDGQGSKLGFDDEEQGDAVQDDAVVALVSSDSMSAGKLARKLNERDDVVLAEKNVKVQALSVNNDPYTSHQWSMQQDEMAPHIEYEWNEKGVKGTEKIVAIVDTGVNYNHPDLKNNMWVNTHRKIKGEHGFDFINGDPDPMDDNGHGTHCAGIIGAVGDNSIGISGVNQNVKIMALKTLDYEGSAWLSHEIAAYNYINMAIDLGEPVVAINNSWGGGEDSGILVKLIDIVGEKGAVTVCAAGNSGSNNDDYPDYPADLDSPYIISVGATGRDGKLAYFSNYGESVDIAAPGVEILSTVSYDSYNPTIYGDEQNLISASYNGFEDDETWGIPDTYYLNGEECEGADGTFTGKDGQTIKVEKIDTGFGDTGHSMQLTFEGLKESDLACFTIPYEIGENDTINPSLSFMATCKSDAAADMFGGPLFGVMSVPEDMPVDLDNLGQVNLGAATYVTGDFDLWDHLVCPDEAEVKPGDRRKFVVLMYAYDSGDFTVRMDDFGISRQDIEEKDFGQYDFMSGTSMAAPFITGTVAIKEAEKAQSAAGEKIDMTDVINEICAMAKEEPEIATGSKGTFDFRLVPDVLPPRIGKVEVHPSDDTLWIKGSGLTEEQEGYKVEIGKEDGEMQEAQVVFSDNRNVIVKDEGWKNTVQDIRVTGAKGKQSLKKNVFLVDGKEKYKEEKDKEFDLSDEAYTTDGKKIYSVWSMSGEIKAFTPSAKEDDSDTIAEINASKLFDIEKQEHAKYGMLFGKDLVYSNKKLYTVIEYGAIDEIESEDDDIIIFGNGSSEETKPASVIKAFDDENEEDEPEGPYAIYAGEYRLVSVDPSGKTDSANNAKNLGELPEELADLEGFTMAAYNGKLYFMGGYRGYGEDRRYSNKVFVYDPSSKKWSDGTPLPEARANGKAVQCGNKLYYTLGENANTKDSEYAIYTARELPDTLVFDGTEWKPCGGPKPLTVIGSAENVNVGVTAEGLIYTGAPFVGLGDTFVYNVKNDEYTDTGYNFCKDPYDDAITAAAVGKTVYGMSEDKVYSLPITSGLRTVKVSKKGKGKVTGAGSYLPGNNVKLTVKASKKYYIKSLKVGSTKIKLKKKATKKTYTIKNITADKTVKVVFAKKATKKSKKSKKK